VTEPAVRVVGEPRPLRDSEFRRLQGLILAETGIFLGPVKKPLIVHRLGRRLRELGLDSFAQYLPHLSDPAERRRMLEAICTHETQFFRERHQFDLLERQVLPAWREAAGRGARPRAVRVWSAGCSTGQEPYSLAMSLLTHLPPGEGWCHDILATDFSSQALAQAAAGRWPIQKSAEIPRTLLRRYMLKGRRAQAGVMAAGPEIRSVIRFELLNLHADLYPSGPFDLIFCRNVLIYFDPAARNHVLARLLEGLEPDGLLFLGHAESLSGFGDRVRHVGPAVYGRGVGIDQLSQSDIGHPSR
jgi:chemotaxis protein methyltransferase CheR